MKVVVKPVNPAFAKMLLQYVSEADGSRYRFVGTEGFSNANYIFDCDEENHWAAVDGLKAIIRKSPLGLIMGCQVVPYGMLTWPPIVDKDKYPKP